MVLRSVSAYRFWLTFIRTTAMSLKGGDDVVARTRGLSCVEVGAANSAATSSRSTAGPVTSMPRADNASFSDWTKNSVGFTTATVRVTADAPRAIAPVI